MVGQMNYSHASFAFWKTGVYQDVFQIGVLLFAADAHIDKVVAHGMNQAYSESGCIIIGKMMSLDKKPFAVVLNRGIQGVPLVIVGPNRIYYDSLNGDEFRVYIPNGYLNH